MWRSFGAAGLAAALVIVPFARAGADPAPASPDSICEAMTPASAEFACLNFIHPGLKNWLLWTVPYTPIGGTWACIRARESGSNYSENTGNGYEGAYQFLPGTWDNAVRGAGYGEYANGRADLAPPRVQDAAAVWLQARDGWSPWGTRWACGV